MKTASTRRRLGRVVLWLVAGIVLLVGLFFLFEYVVPQLLPANF